ncbi:hypothetical protein GCM10025787_56790 [Saccharopolyspora rosea]
MERAVTSQGEEPVDRVVRAVREHPSVVRLDAGRYGDIASHLPGRRVDGVRLTEGDAPVEVGVVLRLDRPLPEIVADLRIRVAGVVGDRPVDVTVSDVVTDEPGGAG